MEEINTEVSDQITPIPSSKNNYSKLAKIWGMGPLLVFVLAMITWGVVGVIFGQIDSLTSPLGIVANVLLPILLSIGIIIVPVGIVRGSMFAIKYFKEKACVQHSIHLSK